MIRKLFDLKLTQMHSNAQQPNGDGDIFSKILVGLQEQQLKNIFDDKITDWRNYEKNDIRYKEVTDNVIIQNALNLEKLEVDEYDESGNDNLRVIYEDYAL